MPSPAAPMWYLAGAPRLARGDEPLRPGSRNAVALALWLQLEGPTRRDRLAEVLWPGAETAAQRRNLRRDVFRLRRAGLDLREDASEALALTPLPIAWPDPGARPPQWLAGLDAQAGREFDDWLAQQRERLHAQWLDELCRRARALEAAGDEAAALALWHAVLDDGVGGADHAEALQESRRLRGLLGRPAGGGEQRSRDAVKGPLSRQQPAPWPVATAVPLVGREAALEAVTRALQRGQRVYLDGPPGVGKTRLAVEAAAPLGGALHAACRPEDAAVPFASAARVLQAFGPDEAATLPAWARRELSAWVPGWQPAADVDFADDPAAGPAQILQRRVMAYRCALGALVRGSFGAWIIDDAQWADGSSLALWGALDTEPDDTADEAAAPLPLVVAHRAAELGPDALEQRRRLVDRGRAVAVTLAPLDGAAALALVRHVTATPAGERFAARLHAATGGNPLFMLETLRHLVEQGLLARDAQGRWTTPFDALTTDYAELPLPASVRAIVLARVRALGEAPRKLLEAASLAGDAFTAEMLAGPAGLTPLAAAQALDHGAAAGLVVAADERGGHRFSHDLVAQAVAEALSPARRAVLHGELAAQLEGAGAAPGRIARHQAAAGRTAVAAAWHHRAGEAARRAGALPESLAEFDAALALATDAGLRARCHLSRARVFGQLARQPEVLPALDAALGEAAKAGPDLCLDVLIARLAVNSRQERDAGPSLELADRIRRDPALTPVQSSRLGFAVGNLLVRLGQLNQALPMLASALATLPGSAVAERLPLLGTYGRALQFSGRGNEARTAYEEQVALAQALGLAEREAIARVQLGGLLGVLGENAQATASFERAAERARASGSVVALRAALVTLASQAANDGDAERALELITEAERAAPFWDNPEVRQYCREGHFYADYLLGRLEPLRAAAEPLLAAARAIRVPFHRLSALRLVTSARLFDPAFGDPLAEPCRELEPLLHEAREVLGAAQDFAQMAAFFTARQAEGLRRAGDPASALALARAGLARQTEVPPDARAELVAVGVEAAVDVADADAAATLLATAPADAEVGMDSRVRLSTARLRCAAAVGEAAAWAAAEAGARARLADPRLPRLEGAVLARRLAALAR